MIAAETGNGTRFVSFCGKKKKKTRNYLQTVVGGNLLRNTRELYSIEYVECSRFVPIADYYCNITIVIAKYRKLTF